MSEHPKDTGMNPDEPPPLPPRSVRRPASPTGVDAAGFVDEPPPFPSRRVPTSSPATTAAPLELPSHAATASAARVDARAGQVAEASLGNFALTAVKAAAAEAGQVLARHGVQGLKQYLDRVAHDLPVWQRMADAGCADAQYLLALCYGKGCGVPQDTVQMTQWLHRAAEQGYARAQFELGGTYYNGQDVATDYAEAVKWYRKAAEQGHAGGQRGVGACCYNGQGTTQDRVEGLKWLRKAAEQGEPTARNFLQQLQSQPNIPKKIAVAMTVATLLPLLISCCGTIAYGIGARSELAFWMSALQNGFAFFASVMTLRKTKRYWLPAMASVLTMISWFWLSFTVLPIGLVVVGTAVSWGVGIWAFYAVRTPEVQCAFDSQFDPVDAAGRFILSRLAANCSPTLGTISRTVVLSLSGLCLVGLLLGGTLHSVDDQLRVREEAEARVKRDAEFQGQKAKQVQSIKEKIQRALTQYDMNKDMAADTLYDASGDGFYSETLNQVAGTLTADQQQKLFQLKQMIQPRIDKRHAEAEEWLRKSREEREKREAAKNVPSQNAEERANGSDEESIKFGVVNDADDVVSAFANEAAALQYVGKRVKIQGKVVQVEQDYTSSSAFASKQYAIVLGGHPGPNGYTTWVKCFVSNAKGAASVRVGGRVWLRGTVQNGNATEVRLTDCEVLEQW